MDDGQSDIERTNGWTDADHRRGFKDLIAWQRAMELVSAVYTATGDWPREELYGLTSQIRRAAVSVPSNLAEGLGRAGPKEFGHHVSIAYGSPCELETQVLIAEQLGYSDGATTEALTVKILEVRRLTGGLLRSLRTRVSAEARR